jgi:hypothetical protein
MNSKNIWKNLLKHEKVITLVASVFTIVWILGTIIYRLLQDAIPLWLLITTLLFSLIICVYLFVFRLKKSSTSKVINQIRFDYLPSPPNKHGWKLEYKNNQSGNDKPPDFSAAKNPPMQGSITISENDRYKMDYKTEQVQSLANIVEYYIKPIHSGLFYLEVIIRSRDSSHKESGWLRHEVGTGQPFMVNAKEWNIYVQGEILKDGWVHVKLNVADEVQQTFGRDGFVLESLCRVRLRGSLSLSPITFYRLE